MTLVEERIRLFHRVDVEPGGCWLWQGACADNGYGHLVVDGVLVGAHRRAYELFCGPIPPGARVLHSCDVRACVNPVHLHLGTAADNSREMVERGRYRGPRKLTDEERQAIAESDDVTRIAAAEYGVSQSTISNIRRGKHP